MTTRRAFLEDVSLASLFAGFPLAAQASFEKLLVKQPDPVLPKTLKPGARVALVSPASPALEPEANEAGAEIVRSLGFVPVLMPNAQKATKYLAGSDEERVKDLNDAFRDPAIDAVWCLRGGYGSPRILPFIDYEAVRKNPKPFIGYSDITAPLNALHRLTGLVTFHGPNASENMSPYSLRELKKVLYAPEAAGVIAQADPFTAVEGQVDKENRLRRIAPGKVRGPLVGGNISVLSTLIGTPFEPEWKGRILFLEEIGEEPYRIDRYLTQFVLTGKLSQCAGIVAGKFKDCGLREGNSSMSGSWTWQQVVADRLGNLGIPLLVGLSFGHVTDKATLPLGVMAELDVAAGTLALLGPAVR